MDLFGDIVEREVNAPPAEAIDSPASGFPKLHQPKKVSSWKQRLLEKRQNEKAMASKDEGAKVMKQQPSNETDTPLTESEKIHLENIALLQNMTAEQFQSEREELFESLNPQVLKSLIARVDKRMGKLAVSGEGDDGREPVPQYAELEGPGTWIGGSNKVKDLPKLDDKAVDEALGIRSPAETVMNDKDSSDPTRESSFLEYDDGERFNDDDIAPQEYQFVQSLDHMSNKDILDDVHFIRSAKLGSNAKDSYEPLSIDDPNFNEELHKKFFPDLPQEPEKLKWMEQLPDDLKQNEVLHEVSSCRFDFKGNLVPPTRKLETTNNGLYHHSVSPELAGYTIQELSHLSLSQFPSQRCIAIQTLGRILYKLGKQSYYQLVPEVDVETYQEEGGSKQIINKIYYMFWDLVKDCKVVDAMQLAADESSTTNLSVRNYAIDALWLWKQGGGDPRSVSKEK